jgi:Tfp pilus assembly protein PilX
MGSTKTSSVFQNNKGNALLVSLIILVVLFLIGQAALKIANTETNITGNDIAAKKAFQAAEGASEYEAMQLRNFLSTSLAWQVPTETINGSIPLPVLSGHTIQETAPIQLVAGSQKQKNATGVYSGLTAWCQSFTITTTARDNNGRARATIMRLVEDQLIPLFQFAVFYNGALEILPGANMTLGDPSNPNRIHSNSDIYLAADGSATMNVNHKITTPGQLHHGTLDGRTLSQPVLIADGLGGHPQLNQDSITDPNWEANATATWNENVQTNVHNIMSLNVPIPGITPGENGYIEMLKQGPATDTYRYSNKAGLKIIDGTAYDRNGTVVNLSSCGSGNPLSTTTLFDKRENRVVTVRDVDMAKLQNCTSAKNALNNPPSGEDPGILYVHETTTVADSSKAVRLNNGSDLTLNNALPSGLMVATDNPLYVKGNYNTGNSRPASIAADAVTFLSTAWNATDDSTHSYQDSLDNRIADNTTFNAAVMTGNVPTTGSHYSGGLENFPRFLENWTGKNMVYGGSLVCLWKSERATGQWVYGGSRYTAPNRQWTYNMNPNNMPPGTPRVRNLQRIQWYQVKN